MLTLEQQCSLLQPSAEILRASVVDKWFIYVQKMEVGSLITVEMLRAAVMQGSLAISYLHGSFVLDCTDQGIRELGEAIQ